MTEDALNLLKKMKSKVNLVVISASWGYFGSSYYYLNKDKKIPLNTPLGKELAKKSLINFIQSIQSNNIEVILIHDIPTHENFSPIKNIVRKNFFLEIFNSKKIIKPKKETINKKEILQKQVFRSIIEDVAKKTQVKLIDPFDYLCDEKDCFIYSPEKKFRYKDKSHLASSFVEKYATYIDQTLDLK